MVHRPAVGFGRAAGEAGVQKQQARAEERETQAIDAVKRFGDAVAGEPILKNSADLEALRKRLLKEPLEFFQGSPRPSPGERRDS